MRKSTYIKKKMIYYIKYYASLSSLKCLTNNIKEL